jgi:hypothetical protein
MQTGNNPAYLSKPSMLFEEFLSRGDFVVEPTKKTCDPFPAVMGELGPSRFVNERRS